MPTGLPSARADLQASLVPSNHCRTSMPVGIRLVSVPALAEDGSPLAQQRADPEPSLESSPAASRRIGDRRGYEPAHDENDGRQAQGDGLLDADRAHGEADHG